MNRRRFIKIGSIGAVASGTGLVTADVSDKFFPATGSESGSYLHEEGFTTPVKGMYDVVVCGAGPAGVSAAIEAGRHGAKTLLIEAHGCLGGVWTSGLLTWILDHANKSGLMREIESGLISRHGVSSDIDTGRDLSFDPEIMKLLLEDLCLEAGVDIILHTRVVASVKDNSNRLSHIITESKSGREAWSGKIFIDTTGDGDLAALSGCGFDIGREEDGGMQPFSLLALIT
mgnify:CR=1 FL=1